MARRSFSPPLLLLLLLAGVAATTPTAIPSPSRGPILSFNFEGDYADATGNTDGLVAVNGQPFVPGARGALAARISAAAGTYLASQRGIALLPSGNAPRSVVAWVRVEQAPGLVSLVIWGHEPHVYSYGDRRNRMSALVLDAGSLGFVGYANDVHQRTPESLADGGWHHFGYTFDGAMMTVFYDGEVFINRSLTLDTRPNTALYLVTPWVDAQYGGFITGALDEVLIYDRALSAAEVRTIVQQQSVTPTYTATQTPSATASQSISSSIQPTPSASPSSPLGPLIAFHFEGDYADATGNTEELVAVNGQPFVPGARGALAARISAAAGTYLTSQRGVASLPAGNAPRSVVAWVRVEQLISNVPLVLWGLQLPADSGARLSTLFVWASEGVGFLGYDADVIRRPVPASLLDGDWHHFGYTFDGAVMTVFYDGAAVASGGLSLNTRPNTTLMLASAWFSDTAPFTGAIDEVLIYDRALSAAEVQALVEPQSATPTYTATQTASATNTATQTASATTSNSITSSATPLPGRGPIVAFHFEGDYADVTGNTEGLVAVNGQPFMPGAHGTLAAFVIGDSTVISSVSTIPSLPAGNAPRSVVAWVKMESGRDGPIVSWGILPSGSVFNRMSSLFSWNSNHFGFAGQSVDCANSQPVSLVGAWHHLGVTFDGNLVTVFYDGGIVATCITSGANRFSQIDTTPNTRLEIFKSWVNSRGSSAIDEVLIYDRALSAAEVEALAAPRSATPSRTPSSTPTATPSATVLTPDCDASAVRRFVGFDVDGVVLTAVLVSTERECREACCALAACAGYAVEAARLLLHGGSTGSPASAGCFLRANITQLVPASPVLSGVVLARVPPL